MRNKDLDAWEARGKMIDLLTEIRDILKEAYPEKEKSKVKDAEMFDHNES